MARLAWGQCASLLWKCWDLPPCTQHRGASCPKCGSTAWVRHPSSDLCVQTAAAPGLTPSMPVSAPLSHQAGHLGIGRLPPCPSPLYMRHFQLHPAKAPSAMSFESAPSSSTPHWDLCLALLCFACNVEIALTHDFQATHTAFKAFYKEQTYLSTAQSWSCPP